MMVTLKVWVYMVSHLTCFSQHHCSLLGIFCDNDLIRYWLLDSGSFTLHWYSAQYYVTSSAITLCVQSLCYALVIST